MSNEFLLEIITAAAIILALIVRYFIVKRSSSPQSQSTAPEKSEIPEGVIQEKITIVPNVKEELKIETLFEIPVFGTEEGEFVITAPTPEDKGLTERRKSDIKIQKRPIPKHVHVTKENFSEFAGERILVAEDNMINQKVIVSLLAGSGIELVLANDGQEALDILENDTNFLMILMDAHMPRVDGFEATRIIRANPLYDHILVVALSGDVASDDIQKMKDAGMAEQLEKPLRMDSLYAILYAYSGQETRNNESIEVDTITSLNREAGVETCGGDESFYREILSEFMSDYGDSADRLGEFLRAHDLHSADALLLDVVGVAENIGAHTLGDIASHLKLSLRDTDEKSYFGLYDQYKGQLNRVIEEIKEYNSSQPLL